MASVSHTEWRWLVLAVLTFLSGSATLKLPSLPATISVSETFVFYFRPSLWGIGRLSLLPWTHSLFHVGLTDEETHSSKSFLTFLLYR